jgi:hypothetical protein
MTPGTLFFDTNFVFHDGEEGKKIFVVLGSRDGVTVVAKTTSRGHRYGLAFGCQAQARFPCYHLPHRSCCLNKPTWVCLDEFYEFRDGELLQHHFSGRINRIGVLETQLTLGLLECSLASDDITGRQETIVKSALANLRDTAE